MRILILLLSFVVMLTVQACAGVKHRALRVNAGDSKDRVIEIMGAPDDRQFNGRQEAWQYGMVVSIGVCDYTVIWFSEGTVKGLTSYRSFSTLGCRHGLKSINWQEAPDRVIEIR